MSISVAIVEDLDAVRNGLKDFISLSTDFLVVGAFKTGEEALAEARLAADLNGGKNPEVARVLHELQ